MLRFLPVGILLLLLALFAWGLTHDPHSIPSEMVGKSIPTFQQQALISQENLDQKIFQGQPTILTVWATWCLSCQSEHAFILELAEKKKLQLVGVNYKDKREIAKQWLSQQGNPYRHIIFDPEGNFSARLGVYGTPETFLIDPTGTVRHRHVGPLTKKVWKKEFLPILNKLDKHT